MATDKTNDSATLPAKLTIKKFSKGQGRLFKATNAVAGAGVGAFAGHLPGALADHGRSALIGAGLGAAVGGITGYRRAGRVVTGHNKLVDNINKAQSMQKKANEHKALKRVAGGAAGGAVVGGVGGAASGYATGAIVGGALGAAGDIVMGNKNMDLMRNIGSSAARGAAKAVGFRGIPIGAAAGAGAGLAYHLHKRKQEKKASVNRYLNKLAEVVENMIQKDTDKNTKSAPKANEKFFTRQKMRGC